MSQVEVSGGRRPSGASERDVDAEPCSAEAAGGTEWARSSAALCSHEKSGTESSMSSESHQPDAGEDCAALLLACLYCRFSDIVLMFPGTCERALDRCFPSYRYYAASSEQDPGKEGSTRSLELDCGLLDACHESRELLELAMEISEICYR